MRIVKWRRDGLGFTLIELLIGLLISSLVVIVSARVLTTASAALAKSTERPLVAKAKIRYAAVMRYDFYRGVSIFAFGPSYPTGAADVRPSCTTATSTTWVADAANANSFRRAVAQVNAKRMKEGDLTSFWELSDLTIGYELRRDAGSRSLQFWRLECATAGVVSRSEMLFQLSSSSAGTGVFSGTDFLFCPGRPAVPSVTTTNACAINKNLLLDNDFLVARAPASSNLFGLGDLILRSRL